MKNGFLAARCLALLGAAVVTLFFTGCAPQGDTVRPGSRFAVYSTAYLTEDNQIVYATHSGPPPARREEWVWNGDGILGAPAITIDLGSQTAYFYKGGQQVGRSPVSTGREGYGTPTGNFKIIQKNKHHVSNLYGDYVDVAGNVVVANVGVKRDRRPPGTEIFRKRPGWNPRARGALKNPFRRQVRRRDRRFGRRGFWRRRMCRVRRGG
jgi:hypothetical protein